MGEAEALLLALSPDPLLRSDFAALLVLERLPDPKRLRAAVERMVGAFPVLRSRAVSSPLRLAPPLWMDEEGFDLDYHLRHLAAPSPGGRRELLDTAATLTAPPIDLERPLFELTVVEGLTGGRAALLARLHHAVADGVQAVRMIRALTGPEAEAGADAGPLGGAEAPATEPGRAAPDAFELAGAEVAHRVWRGLLAARRLAGAVAGATERPEGIWASLARARLVVDALLEQAFVAGGALSPMLTGRSLARRYETLSLPLAEVRGSASRLGGSRRELVVAALVGALRAQHQAAGMPCAELRAGIPLLATSDGLLGEQNRFVAVRLTLPLEPADPVERFGAVAGRLRFMDGHPVTSLAGPLSELAGLVPLPVLTAVARSQARTVDFGTSLLPGLRAGGSLAGVLIEALIPFGPRLGTALNATAVSWRSELHLGLNLDPAAFPEPEAFVVRVANAFEELFDAVRA